MITIGAIIFCLALIYYFFLYKILRKSSPVVQEKQKNIVHSDLNNNFVNNKELKNEEFPNTRSSLFDDLEVDNNNDLLDMFKQTNNMELEEENNILNTYKNEKSSKNDNLRIIKSSKSKE